MITIDECREVLGEGCPLTDDELSELRDQLYHIAELARKPSGSDSTTEVDAEDAP